MPHFNYALKPEQYSIKNALLWGNCACHLKEATKGSFGRRIAHGLIALIELTPGISQIASLFEKFLVEHFRQSDRKTAAKPLSSKKISVGPISSQQAADYHIRLVNPSSQNSQLFFKLHQQLWKGSEKYREVVKAIESRKNQPVAFIDKEAAIALSHQQNLDASWITNFPFRACWSESLNAVILMAPDDFDDTNIGSVMAFEVTNGFQQARFNQVHQEALQGAFDVPQAPTEEERVERAARSYAEANEKIELDGREIHHKIIEEAITSGTVTQDWLWDRRARAAHEMRAEDYLSDYGVNHLNYYMNSYKSRIHPNLERSRPEELRRRQAHLGVPLTGIDNHRRSKKHD